MFWYALCAVVFISDILVGQESTPTPTETPAGPPTVTPTVTPTFEPIPAYNDPVPVVELNSSAGESRPYLTGDLLEIFFVSDRGGDADIWSATRDSVADPWNPPFPVTELNSTHVEWSPVVSAGGLEIFLGSHRGLLPMNDWNRVFRSTRPDRFSPWSTPIEVPELNPYQQGKNFSLLSHLSQDQLRLYMHCTDGDDFDLHVATRPAVGGPFWSNQPLPGVKTSFPEAHAALSGDEKTLIFARQTDRWRLFGAKRHDLLSPFVVLREMGELNGVAGDSQTGYVTPDLSQIWFCSNRPTDLGPNDIYVASNFTPAATSTITATSTCTVTPTRTGEACVPDSLWRPVGE